MNFVRYLPLILCAVLLGLFGFTLLSGKAASSSPLLDQPMPSFELANVVDPGNDFTTATMRKPALLVFWASWCGICRVDLPVVSKFAQDNNIPLYGIAYRDQPTALRSALDSFKGEVSFAALGRDDTGVVSSQYGLIGVPTLFAIDRQGVVRSIIAGQASREVLQNDIRPLLR